MKKTSSIKAAAGKDSKSSAKKPGMEQRETDIAGSNKDKGKRPDMRGASSDAGYGNGQRGVDKSDNGGKNADNTGGKSGQVGVAPGAGHFTRDGLKADTAKGAGTASSHNFKDNDAKDSGEGDEEMPVKPHRNAAGDWSDNVEGRDPTR